MNADSSVELGRDDPALELPWNSADPLVRYFDLKKNPELVAQIPEAAAYPELAAFLTRINAADFPLATAKCDVWSSREVSPEEEIYGDRKFVSYVDLVFEADSSRGSLEKHETFAKELCRLLAQAPDIAATVELVIRRCYYHRGSAAPSEQAALNVEGREAESGYVDTRDSTTRDAEERDAGSGDTEAGSAEVGDAKAGDARAGDARAGDARAGDAEPGDADVGDAEKRDGVPAVVVPGGSEVGNAEAIPAKEPWRFGAADEKSSEAACRQMIQCQNRGSKIEDAEYADVTDMSAPRQSAPRQSAARQSEARQSAARQSASRQSASRESSSRESSSRAEEKRELKEEDNVGASGLPSRITREDQLKTEDSAAPDNGFCFTIYVSGFGDSDQEPQRLWVIALALLQYALVQLSRTWSF